MLRVTIRNYRTSDWPAVCRIHDLAHPIEVGRCVPRGAWVPMEQAAHRDHFFDAQTRIACIEASEVTVAGFISILPPELTWCYVDPSYHRQGVGRKLVEDVMPDLGTDAFVLCIDENPAGIAFYQKFGFVIAARFPGEVDGYPCQCVRLTLPSSAHRRRPPTPSAKALRLAGFSEESPGRPTLGEDGIFYWR